MTRLPTIRFSRVFAAAASLACMAMAADQHPAELTAARANYEARLAVPRAKLEPLVKSRTARYVSDLKEMEGRVATDGKLDVVMAIRVEREAYEKGAKTNGFAAGDAKVPTAARELRAAFDADIARARATVAPEGRAAATDYLRILGELERKLTSQKATEAALAVRREREETQTDGRDPLNPPTSGLIGDWQQPASVPQNSRSGKVFSFSRDGTWRSSAGDSGTWEWTDRSKRKIMFRWNDKPWHNPFTLSTDGKRMEGVNDQGAKLIMDRLP